MKTHSKGLIPIVLVIVIAIIAAGVVGAAWWYQNNKGGIFFLDKFVNKSVVCDIPGESEWENSPCTGKAISEGDYDAFVDDLPITASEEVMCGVYVANSDVGTIAKADGGCFDYDYYITDNGTNYFNAKGKLITNCNLFSVDRTVSDLCVWLRSLPYASVDGAYVVNSSSSNSSNTNTGEQVNVNIVVYSSDGCPTWPIYTDPEFSWTMQYPCDWTYERTYNASGNDPFVTYPERYVKFTDPSGLYNLMVGIMQVGGQGSTINRTGVGAGDFVAQDPITVEGTSVPVRNLEYQNKLKEVFFYQSGSVTIGNYQVISTFDEYNDTVDYNDIDLTGSNELATGTQMLQSLELP